MEQVKRREKDRELFIALGMQPPLDRGADQVKEHRQGDLCPKCEVGHLDYDRLLNLSCPECGYALQGCFT